MWSIKKRRNYDSNYSKLNRIKKVEYNKMWRKNNPIKVKEQNKRRIIIIKNKDFGLYKKYRNMFQRCNNKNSCQFKYYGGRNIKLLWDNYNDFKKDMYKSYIYHLKKYGSKQTTIDRINVNDNYCKKNCRWATLKEQANNKRK